MSDETFTVRIADGTEIRIENPSTLPVSVVSKQNAAGILDLPQVRDPATLSILLHELRQPEDQSDKEIEWSAETCCDIAHATYLLLPSTQTSSFGWTESCIPPEWFVAEPRLTRVFCLASKRLAVLLKNADDMSAVMRLTNDMTKEELSRVTQHRDWVRQAQTPEAFQKI